MNHVNETDSFLLLFSSSLPPIPFLYSVFRQLFIPSLQQFSFVILEFMLLGYQHAPDAFHSLANHWAPLFQFLTTTDNNNNNNNNNNDNIDDSNEDTPTNVLFVRNSVMKALFAAQLYPSIGSSTSNRDRDQQKIDIGPLLADLIHTLMYHFSGKTVEHPINRSVINPYPHISFYQVIPSCIPEYWKQLISIPNLKK